MGASKQMKSAKLGIVLQVTDVTRRGTDGRSWVVHDVERNRGFRVNLNGSVLETAPAGGKPRSWSEDDVQGAIGMAIERFLLASPELVAGPLYDVDVTSEDLQNYARLKK